MPDTTTTQHPKCGTYAGWMRHMRYDEKICGPCRAACSAYRRLLRLRIGRTKTLALSVETLHKALKRHPDLADLLVADLSEEMVDCLTTRTETTG